MTEPPPRAWHLKKDQKDHFPTIWPTVTLASRFGWEHSISQEANCGPLCSTGISWPKLICWFYHHYSRKLCCKFRSKGQSKVRIQAKIYPNPVFGPKPKAESFFIYSIFSSKTLAPQQPLSYLSNLAVSLSILTSKGLRIASCLPFSTKSKRQ